MLSKNRFRFLPGVTLLATIVSSPFLLNTAYAQGIGRPSINTQVTAERGVHLDIWEDSKARPGVNGAKRRLVGVLVTDDYGHPIEGARVQFTGEGVVFTDAVVQKGDSRTDKGGYITVTVESTGGTTGKVTATALPATDESRATVTINF